MKLVSKTVIFATIAFILSSLSITAWYLMQLGQYQESVSPASVMNILLRFGILGAVPMTILCSLGYVCCLTIKNKWVLAVILIVLLVLLNLASLWFLWNVGIRSLTHDPFTTV